MAGDDMLMHYVDLHALAKQITYRKGYRLEVATDTRARWVFEGDDNFGRYDSITVVHQWFDISPYDSEEHVIAKIFMHLAYIEDHEMRERFKVRGKSVYNPHIKGAEIEIRHLLPEKLTFKFYGDDLR